MTEPDRRRGPRGAYRKSAARRVAILDAALEVFAGSGYRAGSLRAVAERVGMSEAGLLHHFPSKPALLAAVLARRDELSRAGQTAGGDGLAALAELVGIARDNAAAPGIVELYCILSAEATSPEHPAHGYFVDRYARLRATLSASLEDLRRRDLLAPGTSVPGAAASVVAVWDGLQVQWLLDRDAVDVAAGLAAHVGRLVTVPLPAR